MLLPAGIEGMLVAGKYASNDYEGFGCNRGMGNVMGLGQAAGVAAALSCKNKVTHRSQDVKEIQAALRAMGTCLSKEEYAHKIPEQYKNMPCLPTSDRYIDF
jgi:hypothetical protein